MRTAVLRGVAMAAALSVALGLSACGNRESGMGSDGLTTGSTEPASLRDLAEAGKKWEADPANIDRGLAYASQLKGLGQTDRQLAVLKTVAQKHPDNADVQAIYGKELVRVGKAGEAAQVLERAAATGKADWKVHSALGSAYDQQERYAEARAQYETALKLEPNEVSVLNNLGMSYALEGNLKSAEATLREAYGLPAGQSHPRIRQNLALVVGLSGRYEEAKKIASKDLPPAQVEANMAYLQKMMAQSDTWQKLQGDDPG